MDKKHLSPREIDALLRMRHFEKFTMREIAHVLQITYEMVREYLDRAEIAGLYGSVPADMSPSQFDRIMYSEFPDTLRKKRPIPDWIDVFEQHFLQETSLRALWEEYKLEFPEGYTYSWFCKHYREFADANFDELLSRRTIDEVETELHGIGEDDPSEIDLQEATIPAATVTYSTFTSLDALGQPGGLSWSSSNFGAVDFIGRLPRYVEPDNC